MGFTPELHHAVEFLRTLKRGDRVILTRTGRDLDMTVSRPAHLSDGAYGAYESTGVTLSLPNGYATRVEASSLVDQFTTDRVTGRTPSWMRQELRKIDTSESTHDHTPQDAA